MDGVATPGTTPEERGEPWKGRRERICPTSSFLSDRKSRTSHGRAQTTCDAALGFWIAASLNQGHIVTSIDWGASGSPFLPPGFQNQKAKTGKLSPRGTPGALILFSAQLEWGLNWIDRSSRAFCACKGRPHHHTRRRKDGRRPWDNRAAECHGRAGAGVLGFVGGELNRKRCLGASGVRPGLKLWILSDG